MPAQNASPVLVVVGPTASGKTGLAVTMAEQLNGEVINADSVQIYRHFDIGSGKPMLEDRCGIAHHLIDHCDPLEPIDAAQYASMAALALEEVRARGRVPSCGSVR